MEARSPPSATGFAAEQVMRDGCCRSGRCRFWLTGEPGWVVSSGGGGPQAGMRGRASNRPRVTGRSRGWLCSRLGCWPFRALPAKQPGLHDPGPDRGGGVPGCAAS